MASTPEGIVKQCIDYLLESYAPDLWVFPPQAGPYGRKGIPDRVGSIHGVFFAIEAKADKAAKTTPLQDIEREAIVASKSAYFLVFDDATLEEVRLFLDACVGGEQSPIAQAARSKRSASKHSISQGQERRRHKLSRHTAPARRNKSTP